VDESSFHFTEIDQVIRALTGETGAMMSNNEIVRTLLNSKRFGYELKKKEEPKPEASKVEVVKCILYQKCPVCEGTGVFNHYNPMTTILTSVCHVCRGSGIIPMKTIETI
jgi:hypothetical protein